VAATCLVILSYSVSSYWCFSFDRMVEDDDHKNPRNRMELPDLLEVLSDEAERSIGEAVTKIISPRSFVKIMAPTKVRDTSS